MLHVVKCNSLPGTAQRRRWGKQLTLWCSLGQALHPLCDVVGQQGQRCLGCRTPQCRSLGQALILPW